MDGWIIYLPAGHESSENSKEFIRLHFTWIFSKERNHILVSNIHGCIADFQIIKLFHGFSAKLVHDGCKVIAGIGYIAFLIIVRREFLTKLLQPAAKLIVLLDEIL